MKANVLKYLSIFVFLLARLYAWGQVPFVLHPVPAEGGGSAGQDEILAHAMIKNLTDSTIVIAWERTLEDMPENWQTYVCSNITCAPPDVIHGTFSLTGGDSTNLDCYFLPDDVGAFATVNLRLFYLDDTTQTLTGIYHCDATAVAQQELSHDEIRVYPNPVKHILHFKIDKPTGGIVLYNMLGEVMLKEPLPATSVDVARLPAGNYLLHILDGAGRVLKTDFIQKM